MDFCPVQAVIKYKNCISCCAALVVTNIFTPDSPQTPHAAVRGLLPHITCPSKLVSDSTLNHLKPLPNITKNAFSQHHFPVYCSEKGWSRVDHPGLQLFRAALDHICHHQSRAMFVMLHKESFENHWNQGFWWNVRNSSDSILSSMSELILPGCKVLQWVYQGWVQLWCHSSDVEQGYKEHSGTAKLHQCQLSMPNAREKKGKAIPDPSRREEQSLLCSLQVAAKCIHKSSLLAPHGTKRWEDSPQAHMQRLKTRISPLCCPFAWWFQMLMPFFHILKTPFTALNTFKSRLGYRIPWRDQTVPLQNLPLMDLMH